MARQPEPLDGGLVTIRDPAKLRPGQLSSARNCLYLPGQGAIQRASGRAAFGTVSATAVNVNGLRDVQFDNGDQYLVAHAADLLFVAPIVGASVTGTFVAQATGTGSPLGSGATLEAAQYQNRFFLFNGTSASADKIGTNKVLYLSATAAGSQLQCRQHGLLPVVAPPTTASAAGTFALTDIVSGYYEYWTTEVAKFQQDGVETILEGSFGGGTGQGARSGPATVFVGSTGVVPIITRPAIVNSGFATHWRVYRSTLKELPGDVRFPIGFMVAEMGTATAVYSDTASATQTSFFLASATGIPGGGSYFNDLGNAATGMFAAGATFVQFNSGQQQALNTFSFGGFSGPVAGIELRATAYATGGTGALVFRLGGAANPINDVVGRRAVKSSPFITANAPGSPQTFTIGSSSDRWVQTSDPGFTDTDFGTNFTVGIESAAGQSVAVFVDAIQLRISYGAISNTAQVIPFPSVVYEFGGVSAQVGRRHPPPSSNTGDMYQDQLVVNDLSNRSLIRWSYPGEPESFPPTYYLDFETRENDIVRAIKKVNNRLLVWLDRSSYRVNYLPSERDASFDRGRAFDPVSTNFGCVSPMCVATFSMDDSPELAAFVSYQGVHITDGFSFKTISKGLDWRSLLALSASQPIALVDDPERRQLLFFFQNTSGYGNETYLCLPFCYHSDHLIDGLPKPGGLIHLRNYDVGTAGRGDLKSAWVAPRSNGDADVFLGYGGAAEAGGGRVYIETGTSIPAEDPSMSYITRRIYANGEGSEWELGEVYGYALGYGATAPTVNYTLLHSKTNDTGETTKGVRTITLGGQSIHKVVFRQMVEGVRVSAQITASAYAQENLILDGTGFGIEDSGR